MFKIGPLGSYFAGIATVVVALSAGFAGGAHVGSSWGSIERLPAVATNQNHSVLAERREIPLVQAVSVEPPDEQAVAAKAKAIKTAAARKDAERRKTARAERRKNAERSRQIAAAETVRKIQASAKAEELKATPSVGLNVGFAPQVQ